MWNANDQIRELGKIKYKGLYMKRSIYKGDIVASALTDKYKLVMQPVFTFGVEDNTKDFFKDFCNALVNTGALHAGGSLTLIAISTPRYIKSLIYDIKKGGIDLDIYVDANKYLSMLNFLTNYIGFEIEKTVGTPAYDASFMRENQIIARIRLKKEDLSVDLMIVHNKNGKTPLDVVQNFDLTCCEVWFDGNKCNASNFDDFKERPVEFTAGGLITGHSSGTDEKARVTTMRPQYISKYISGNNFLHRRVRKYEMRGFVIKFPCTQDIYYITRMKGKKHITNAIEFLLSKLYAHVFTTAQIAQLVEASLENEWPFQEADELKKFLNIGMTDEFKKFVKKIRGIVQITSMGISVALNDNNVVSITDYLMPYLYDNRERDLETYTDWIYKISDRFGIDWSRFITAISNTELDLSIKSNLNQFIIEIFAQSSKRELIEFGVSVFNKIQNKEALDLIKMEDVRVSDYLAEDKDNIVVVEQDDASRINKVFLTRIRGNGGLKDFIRTKYFVKCHSSETARASDTESTQFKEWYIKIMGRGNICVPMGAVYDVCTMIENEEAEPIIIVSSSNIKNASDVETTYFEQGLNIFMDQVNVISATHCSASEHFMENVAYVRKF